MLGHVKVDLGQQSFLAHNDFDGIPDKATASPLLQAKCNNLASSARIILVEGCVLNFSLAVLVDPGVYYRSHRHSEFIHVIVDM
jgi:hypothetical protein